MNPAMHVQADAWNGVAMMEVALLVIVPIMLGNVNDAVPKLESAVS